MEEILLVNPRRGKRRAKKSRRSRARRRSASGRRSRRLRNPRMGLPSIRGITGEITPAIIGAIGAMGLDIAMAYAPLPDALKSGWGKTAAQLGGALLLGFAASRVPFVGRRNAQVAVLGALTVVAYNAIRPLAADSLGAKVKGLSGLADFGDYSMGAYMNPRLGAYMNAAPALLPGRSPIAAMQASSGVGAYLDNGF